MKDFFRKKKMTRWFFSLWLSLLIIILWQFISSIGVLPAYMLPSPLQVITALIEEFPILFQNAFTTVSEAILGLALGVLVGSSLAILMDYSFFWKKSLMPLLFVTQTIPAIALAPLLVLWFGYGMLPKILLIFLTCFFPMAIGLLGGLQRTDMDIIRLMESMGATKKQIYRYVKLPGALPEFFSSLKISASYSLVGAVVAEWLGGNSGLGVYMTRVRKSYSFDKMFAVIVLISLLSILFVKLVEWASHKAMPWKNTD